MADWIVNLIVGLVSAVLGFIGGFYLKAHIVKIKQKVKGDNNVQIVGGIDNGEQNQSSDKRK